MELANDRKTSRLKLLILYDDWTAQTTAVQEQMLAFRDHSENEVAYVVATGQSGGARDADEARQLAAGFDVLVLHHSVRLCVEHYINPAWAEALADFSGTKVLFLQDDYEGTETARRWIERLGFHVFFTVVPEAYWERVYPRARFPDLEMHQVLTGYVPQWAMDRRSVKPLGDRSRFIGYRAFELPYYFGDLAREKFMIGKRMREICQARGIATDIEWDVSRRIYGPAWHDFIEDCRATLGTESGSNVFDEDGSIERGIAEALRDDPALTYEQIHERFLREHEGQVRMNQISPRIFEAIALGSALVLFEGEYSGIVKPGLHYIPLKKDFSNVDEVLEKLRDTAGLDEMTRRARSDVIDSGMHSYQAFISRFDEVLRRRAERRERPRGEFWLSAGRLADGRGNGDRQHMTPQDRHLWLTSEPFTSSENSKAFFARHSSGRLDAERAEREAAATASMRSYAERLQAEVANLKNARQKAAEKEKSLMQSTAILSALQSSRRAALARALRLCGPPPKPKSALAEEHCQALIGYVKSNRWLSRIADRDPRLKKALQPPPD